jgi:hypothetical protein
VKRTPEHFGSRRPLLSTRALGLGVVSLGAGLAAPAALAPAAQANCVTNPTNVCNAFSADVYPGHRENGPWAGASGYITGYWSNRAHYYDCAQNQYRTKSGRYYYAPSTSYPCGTSAVTYYQTGKSYYGTSQNAHATDWGNVQGCYPMWARENRLSGTARLQNTPWSLNGVC